MGVPVLNRADSIENADDKWKTHQALAKAGLPQPRSYYFPEKETSSLSTGLKGEHFVLKSLKGSKGNGVEKKKKGENVTTLSTQDFVQQQVQGKEGTDYRYLVLNGQVLAAMKRVAPEGQFLSNIAQGAKPERVEIDPKMADLAVKASKALNLQVAGVDMMLDDEEGPVILEVNGTPGFMGLEKATGLNIAEHFLKAAVKLTHKAKSRENVVFLEPNAKPRRSFLA